MKSNYSYQIGGADDPLNRIQAINYDLSGPRDTSEPIAAAAAVSYEYMTSSGDQSRIKKIRSTGILTEDFAYDSTGRVSDYTQTVDYRTSYPWTVTYAYDTLDRVTDVRYPAQYGLAGSPRKLTQNTYGIGSRLSSLTVDSQEVAGNFIYNASSQITSMKVGAGGTNQITENYTFDSQTGLMTNQQVVKNGSALLDLSYDYTRNNSSGSLNGKTGHLTKILDNLNSNKNREYEFDALGRLTKAKGGVNGALWNQQYSFDRYGNRTNIIATGVAADGSSMPADGIPNLAIDSASNRITTSGFQYDSAGNQTRALAGDGVAGGVIWVKYEYDAANRLREIRRDDGVGIQAFLYGSTNARLLDYDYAANLNKFFANAGGTVLAEYTEFNVTVPTWTKTYTYLGDRQFSTVTPNGSGGEYTEYNHPDRLGTRLITNQTLGTSYEQAHLPFGTALDAESTITTNSKRFTSYERSVPTGLDYAQNRTYDSKLGRFTQVDPIGMSAASLFNPQSLNLYNYVGNDPINRTDPDGLFWGAIGRFFRAVLRIIIAVAIIVALVVIAIVAPPAGVWGWAAFAAGALAGFKYATSLLGGLKEILNPCNVPSYDGLSQARRDELAQRGVTADQWNSLRNKQRLGYFNIVAAIAAAGLSLLGWLVDWAAGRGIQQDRTFFIQGPGATNLLAQVRSSNLFSLDKFKGTSYRLNSFTRSTELTFSSEGRRLEVDIDIFNPNRIPFGLILHGLGEIIPHKLGGLFGGSSRTNPYNVAYRSAWECK